MNFIRKGGSVCVPFAPTPDARVALKTIHERFSWMNDFTDGPYDEKLADQTEASLWAACYEIRHLLGHMESSQDGSDRLSVLWTLLRDGVLRSMILSRGGRIDDER